MEKIQFIAAANPEELHLPHHVFKFLYVNFLENISITSDKTPQSSFVM